MSEINVITPAGEQATGSTSVVVRPLFPGVGIKPAAVKQVVPEVVADQGMVLYTDGGVRPGNPGPAGWGVHGYMYSAEKPKKGAGNNDFVITSAGYVLKTEFALYPEAALLPYTPEEYNVSVSGKNKRTFEVSPIHYVDGFGSFSYPATNNVAELTATLQGLLYAANYDIKFLHVYTDSEYVRRGVEQWLAGWIRNGWVKQDGISPVANKEVWLEMIAARNVLLSRGVHVKIIWVRGHDDDLGNTLADKGATAGVMQSQRKLFNRDGAVPLARTSIESSPATGYWKSDSDRHPMVGHRRMYFTTLNAYCVPGTYYLGEHGKEDEYLGKRMSAGAYSIVMLDQPESTLELVRNRLCDMAGGGDSLMIAKLDHLYSAGIQRELSLYRDLALVRSKSARLDVESLNEEPLLSEQRPERLGMRAVDAITEMMSIFERFMAKDPTIVETDITAILYETTEVITKKNPPKVVSKLKSEYNVGFAALNVDANYQSEDTTKTALVILTLGIDMLDRNALKRLEETNPKVSLITWLESPSIFRYATVILSGKDKGIWAGVYSNIRVLT